MSPTPKDGIVRLLRDLKDDDWTVRQDAVNRISRLSEPWQLEELLEHLLREKWYVREAAAAGIRANTHTSTGPVMIKALSCDDPIIRNAAVSALGTMKYRDAEGVLARAANDPDCRIQKTARTSLELIRNGKIRKTCGTRRAL